jgi:ATP-dependent DNA helicase RecQ
LELKDIRNQIAMRENVPAYIILSDATLLEIATYLPAGLTELRQISGFGDVKIERYGNEFSEAVAKYCTQHELTSLISKKQPKRERKARTSRFGATFTETLNLYKSGLSIAEIAHERKLSPMTIESHLCQFVQSGEMDIAEFVAENKMAPIKDAIESYGYERLAPLKEILGEDYTYTEIKAMVAWMQRETV